MINLNNNAAIKHLYDDFAEKLLLVYANMEKNQSFNLNKNDILISFDAFFQCLMVKSVLHKRSFEVGEVNYIKNLVKFSDFLKNYNIVRDTYPSKEIEDSLRRECSSYLKKVPDVATMSILVDREIETSILKSKVTFSRMLYDFYEEIVSIVIDDAEDAYAEKVLIPMKEFFIKNHVLEFVPYE